MKQENIVITLAMTIGTLICVLFMIGMNYSQNKRALSRSELEVKHLQHRISCVYQLERSYDDCNHEWEFLANKGSDE